MATPAPPSDLPKATADALEQSGQQISQIVELFIELGVLVHDFQGSDASTESLVVRLNQTIEQLDTLTRLSKPHLTGLPVPLDVLQYIEDGRNPNVYTREFVESTRKSNQHLRGKMVAFEQLRDILGTKIEREFPELREDIADIYKKTSD